MRRLSIALAVAASGTAALAAPAVAAGGPPLNHVYLCYAYANGLQYGGSVQLKTRTVYLTASDSHGNRLVGRTGKGKYSLSGNHLHFLTGAYKGLYGVWIPKARNQNARINLTKHGYKTWSGVSCYPA